MGAKRTFTLERLYKGKERIEDCPIGSQVEIINGRDRIRLTVVESETASCTGCWFCRHSCKNVVCLNEERKDGKIVKFIPADSI